MSVVGFGVENFVGLGGSPGDRGRVFLAKTPGEQGRSERHETYDSALFQL